MFTQSLAFYRYLIKRGMILPSPENELLTVFQYEDSTEMCNGFIYQSQINFVASKVQFMHYLSPGASFLTPQDEIKVTREFYFLCF